MKHSLQEETQINQGCTMQMLIINNDQAKSGVATIYKGEN